MLFSRQTLSNLTLPELEDLCALVMDVISEKQVPGFNCERSLVCPHCGSIHCVKNGKVRLKQRFLCRDCCKTFGASTGTAFASSNLPKEKWQAYVKCMVEGRTLEKSAELVGVCLKTSFYMRHKILNALASIETSTVSGTVQMDETFVAESFKGNHKKSGFQLPRKARKRGHQVTKRGLSREQVCVGTAIDRNANLIMGMTGHGRVSCAELERLYEGYVTKGSTLWTDGLNSYKKLSKKLKAHHEMVPSGEYAKGDVNLAHINSLHRRFRGFLEPFHGVSTKFLGNYLAWFRWAEQAKGLRESAKAGQMWKDALGEAVDVRIGTIRRQVAAFV